MSTSNNIVDWETCLQLNNNKANTAKEMLDLLAQELPGIQINITLYHQQQNWQALEQVVHKLHGSCCYCAIPRLKEKLEKLEALLKNNNTESLEHPIKELSDEINQVITELHKKEYLPL